MFTITIVLFIVLLASCKGSKLTGYHIEGLSDSTKVQLPEMKYPQAVIQPDDILEIKITGGNDKTIADIITKSNSHLANGQPNYLVDKNGFIEFYLLGKIKVAGLTKEQARDAILVEADKNLKDAGVVIRFVNFRFTVLGEVRISGSIAVPNEKISILEAVAMVGDFTQFAKRNTVRIIRDSSGVREIGTVNFNQKTLFTSPYYYLRRNDIVIVERDNRPQAGQTLSTVSSIVAIVSSIITLYYVIKK